MYDGVDIIYAILNLGIRWRRVVSFTTQLLYPRGKSLRNPLDRRMGGPQGLSGRYTEEKNLLLMPGIQPRPSNP
jgi:hypothetical protein